MGAVTSRATSRGISSAMPERRRLLLPELVSPTVGADFTTIRGDGLREDLNHHSPPTSR